MKERYIIELPENFEDFPQDDGLYIERLHDDGILVNCKAFYYVFCDLEKQCSIPWNDPERMKKYYEEYKKGNRPNLAPALVTNGILAAELALKYLSKIETSTFEHTHYIDKLFYSLPKNHRDNLSDIIKNKTHQNDETLKQNLKTIKKYFVDWRYSFEHSIMSYTGFLNDFIHIVCDYAINKPNTVK